MKNLKNNCIGKCRDCGLSIHKYDEYWILPTNELICDVCYERNYFICDCCSKVLGIEDLYQRGKGESDAILCLECVEKYYNICSNCLDPYPKEDLKKDDICVYCLEMNELFGEEKIE